MAIVSSLSSPMRVFSLYTKKPTVSSLHLKTPRFAHQNKLHFHVPSCVSSIAAFNMKGTVKKRKNVPLPLPLPPARKSGVVCYAHAGAPLTTTTSMQWISTISSVVLMFAKGTGIQKSFIVPLFALLAPASIISWIKGEYGIWATFLALLVRLFFFIPGELELAYVASLFVIIAPYEVIKLRSTKEGTIISLVIAGYLAFQHFTRIGSLKTAFEQGSIVATLALISILAVSGFLLI